MNCPNCGTSNLDNASVCVNCGRSLSAAAPSYTPPPNYLWQSIVVTLCCCLPLGVVAIIFAAQVNSKWAQGDVAGAQEASRKAKMFVMIGAAVGLVVIILSLILNGAAYMEMMRGAQTAT